MGARDHTFGAKTDHAPSRRDVMLGGAAGALAGLAGLPTVARAQTPEETKIDVWAVRDPQEAASIALAKELNFYKDEGLDVTIKWIVSGTDMPSLIASGQINFAGESIVIPT